MKLTLRVTSHQSNELGSAAIKSFDERGGTFGRSDASAWVIPDERRVISGQHGRIFFKDGKFHLEDLSTNGIFINSEATPLGKGQIQELRNGDTLEFSDYQVQVELAPADSEFRKGFENDIDLFGQVQSSKEDRPDFPDVESEASGPDSVSGRNEPWSDEGREPFYDPLAAHAHGSGEGASEGSDISNQPAGSSAPPRVDNSPLSSAFEPRKTGMDPESVPGPDSQDEQGLIPEDWDEIEKPDQGLDDYNLQDDPKVETEATDTTDRSRSARPTVLPGQKPERASEKELEPELKSVDPGPQTEASSAVDLYSVFMKGAGMDPEALGAGNDRIKNMETAGKLFKELVDGLMLLLQSRAELKNEFRMSATTIKPTENNPLKFTPNADEALRILFDSNRRGFLNGEEAIDEAIRDIRNHQIAMIAAMHAGIQGLMDKFQPRHFEKEDAEGIFKAALNTLGKKSRAWENFRNYYERVIVEPGDAFQILCAEDFEKAYNEHLLNLESMKGD